MEELEQLLASCPWAAREAQWRKLTTGATLFDALQKVTTMSTPADWPKYGELVEELPAGYKQTDQYKRIQLLLWCAREAQERAQRHQTEFDYAAFTKSLSLPPYIATEEKCEWAWGCIRSFLAAAQPRQPLIAPVALVEPNSNTASLLALQLEVLAPGGGVVFPHPADAFRYVADETFTTAIRLAWRAARRLVEGEEASRLAKGETPSSKLDVDGRWRLQALDGEAVPSHVEGNSAGGAAAYGWLSALQGKVADPYLIVLAAVEPVGAGDYQLVGVDGIAAKVAAISGHRGYDTIVVADDVPLHGKDQGNFSEAVSALRALERKSGAGEKVRVTRLTPAKFDQLVTVQSFLMEEALKYLDGVAKQASALPSFFPAHLRADSTGQPRFDQIRQMVQVVTDRTAYERWLAENQERTRASGIFIESRAYKPARSRPELGEVGHQDEEARWDEGGPYRLAPPPVVWDEQLGARFRRAIILGDPGFGKTWLLRYEARRLALQAAQELRTHVKQPDEVVFPIFIRLSELNVSDNLVQDALINLVAAGRDRIFQAFLRQKLASESCMVLLDAWDEVPVERSEAGQPLAFKPHYRQRLGQRLGYFARDFPQVRILLTSRIVGYSSAPSAPIPDAQELELLAFESPQIEAFVQEWFGNEDRADRVFEMVRQRHQVQGLAHIPLMLALMCRAHQENHVEFPTRRVELYEHCLRGLLLAWKQEKERLATSLDLEYRLQRLAQGAFILHLARREQFAEEELAKACGFDIESVSDRKEAYTFVEECKADGLFITVGEHVDAPLLFLHRTFHEYLTARFLAKAVNSSQAKFKKNAWRRATIEVNDRFVRVNQIVTKKAWSPAWSEVIVLLAGQLEDPQPLLTLLADRKADDYFRHRLALAAVCLPELPNIVWQNGTNARYMDKIITSTLAFWWRHVKSHTEEAIPHIKHTLPGLAHLNRQSLPAKLPLLQWLCGQVSHKDAVARNAAVETLRAMGAMAAQPEVLDTLMKSLCHRQRWETRLAAARALDGIGLAAAQPAAVDTLVSSFVHEEHWEVQMALAQALSAKGSMRVQQKVLDALVTNFSQQQRWEVRLAVVQAISAMGPAAAQPGVLEALMSSFDPKEHRKVRVAVAQTLSAMGPDMQQRVQESLMPKLSHRDQQVRRSAAEAFGAMGIVAEQALLDRLVVELYDPDQQKCRSAASMLGALGPQAAQQPVLVALVNNLSQENLRSHVAMARALGAMGRAAAQPFVLKALARNLAHRDPIICRATIDTLGAIGPMAAQPFVLDALILILDSPDYGELHRAVRWTLSVMGPAAARQSVQKSLVAKLSDKSRQDRQAAADALIMMEEVAPHELVFNILMAKLFHYDPEMRRSAALALERTMATGQARIFQSPWWRKGRFHVQTLIETLRKVDRQRQTFRPENLARFWLTWILVSSIGVNMGRFIGTHMINFYAGSMSVIRPVTSVVLFFAFILGLKDENEIINLLMMWSGLLESIPFVLLLGATVGFFQWLLLRKNVSPARRWIWVSSIGWTIGSAIGLGLLSVNSRSVELDNYVMRMIAIAAAWAGLGTFQWFFLRQYVPRAGWWIVVTMIDGLVNAYLVSITARLGVSFGIFGVATGLTLFWLMQTPLPDNPHLDDL